MTGVMEQPVLCVIAPFIAITSLAGHQSTAIETPQQFNIAAPRRVRKNNSPVCRLAGLTDKIPATLSGLSG